MPQTLCIIESLPTPPFTYDRPKSVSCKKVKGKKIKSHQIKKLHKVILIFNWKNEQTCDTSCYPSWKRTTWSPTTVSKHKTHASHRIFCDQLVTKLHLTKHTKDASPTNINFIKLKRIYVTRYTATFLNPTLILNSSFPTGWLRRIFSSFKSLWTISEIYFIKTSCKYNWFDVNDRPTILPFVYLSSPEFSLTTFQESWRNISTHPKLYIVSISSSQFFFLFHFLQCPISLLFPH